MLPSNNIQNYARHHVSLIVALVGLIGASTLVPGPERLASAQLVGPSSTTVLEAVAFKASHAGSARADHDCTQIDVLGATATAAMGINAHSDITGQFTDANNVIHGFLLPKHGPMVVIDHPDSTRNSALAINSKGLIAGNWEDAAHQRRGFIWNDGQFTDVEFPGSSFTSATSINRRGDVAGQYILAGQTHGFTFSDGVCGGVYATVDVPGATATAIFALNNDGELGGNYVVGTGPSAVTHGFILSDDELTTVDWPDDTLPTSFNSVRGIARGGDIVVGSHHGPNTTATHGYILVDDELTNFDYPAAGVTSTAIFGVNRRGRFVGGFNVGSVSATFQHGYVCRWRTRRDDEEGG